MRKVIEKIKNRLNKNNGPVGTLFNLPEFPSYICLEITNSCNLRCIHCLYKGGTTGHYRADIGFVDVDFAQHILNQLKAYECAVMLNGDGESLLHPNFHQIAKYAMMLNLPNVYFNTNGTLFSPDFTDEFVTYFKGMVAFSLDGFKESHERIRRGSSYERLINNIMYLRQRIKDMGAPIKICASYCNYNQPEGEREAFVKHWTNVVDIVSVCEVYDKDYRIISDQINRPKEYKRIMCGVPWQTFIVRWNGLVIPCSNCFSLGEQGNAEIIMGDANVQSLREIWHSENFIQLRKKTEHWRLKGTVCEKCERWNMFVLFGEKEEEDLIVSRSGVFTTYRNKQ